MFSFSTTGLAAASDSARRTLPFEQNFQESKYLAHPGTPNSQDLQARFAPGEVAVPDQRRKKSWRLNGND